jgi:YD repeat-containing protein
MGRRSQIFLRKTLNRFLDLLIFPLKGAARRLSDAGGSAMVAIVTSGGLGLDRSSANILGAAGLLGQAALGQANDDVYVNAATGNLVVTSTDEMLFGTGQDAILANTYNSQGQFNGADGDNWRDSVLRSVGNLTGALGAAGSTVTRTDGDGSQVVFAWNASDDAYVAKESSGAYDTLTLSGSTWTWTNGSTQATETYDNANGGRILTSVDKNGEGLAFSYNSSGQVSRVTTQTGEYTNFVYTGSNLAELDTYSYANTGSSSASGALIESTRVRYGYNASNQLTTVTVSLTPTTLTGGSSYVTNYGYDANGNLNSITQSDGTSLQIGYTQIGGLYRVTSLTQAVSSGVSRTTTFSYDTTNLVTTVTDPTGQVTKLTYDASGDLLKIDQAPAVSGGSDQVTSFTYDANGNVLSQTLPGGQTTTYQYDANGNRTFQQDSLGNTITWTYSSTDQLLTETRYTVPASASAGGAAFDPSQAVVAGLGDVNGDGYTDVVMRNNTTGQWGYFAGGASGYTWVSMGVFNTAYTIVGVGDINGDGIADVVWQNKSTGDWGYTAMSASGTGTWHDVGVLSEPIVGVGDITGDGKADVVWQDPSSLSYGYATVNSGSSGFTSTFISTSTDTVVAVADVSGSGRGAVIIMNNADNGWEAIGMNASGAFTWEAGAYTDPTYKLVGLIDMNGDGTADPVWRKDSTGDWGYNPEYANGSQGWVDEGVTRPGATAIGVGYPNGNGVPQVIYLQDLPTGLQYSAGQPSGAETTYYAYDAHDNLRYTISAQGDVTQYNYNPSVSGQLVSTVQPTATLYNVSGLSPSSPPTLGQLDSWFTGLTDLSKAQRTDTTYDFRGNLASTTTYAQLTTAGVGVTTSGVSKVVYVYDQAGRLLSKLTTDQTGAGAAQTYAYDGLGRVIAATDPNGNETTTAYDAAEDETVVTNPDNTTLTNVYDLAGELVSSTKSVVSAGGAAFDPSQAVVAGLGDVNGDGYTDVVMRNNTTGQWGYFAGGASGYTWVSMGVFNTAYTIVGVGDINGDGIADVVWQNKSTGDWGYTAMSASGTGTWHDVGVLSEPIVGVGDITGDGKADVVWQDPSSLSYGYATVNSGSSGFTSTFISTSTDTVVAVADVSGSGRGAVIIMNNADNGWEAIGMNASGAFTWEAGAYTDPTYKLVGLIDMNGDGTADPVWRKDSTGDWGYNPEYANGSQGWVDEGVTRPGATAIGVGYPNGNGVPQVIYLQDLPTGLQGGTVSTPVATTTYKYDAQGNLRISTDALGQSTDYLYDSTGRKVAQVLPDGSLTEYVYDADNNLIETIAYATQLTSAQLASLVDANGNPTSVTLASIRPAAASGDARSYSIYDAAGRVVETIDPAGAVTTYAYDGANELVSKTAYANILSASTLMGFETTLPTALVLPTANPSADQTTRYFYDPDGNLIGTLDSLGYLTQSLYDATGRKTDIYQYATATSAALWTSGTFAQLLASTGSSPTSLQAADIHQTYAYDDRGLLTASTDGAGNTTNYAYNGAGQVTSVTDAANHQTQNVYDNNGNLVAVIDADDNVTRYAYDADNRQIYAVDGAGDVTYTQYNPSGEVSYKTVYADAISLTSLPTVATAAQIAALVAPSAYDRVTTNTYNADGELVGSTVDQGSGKLNLITSYAYDPDGRLAAVTDAEGDTTRYAYDALGRQAYVIDPMGDVTYTQYDNDGRVTQTTAYATPISLTNLPLVNTASAVAALVTASPGNDHVTTNAYDAFGRLTSTVVDPGSGHLALTTSYAYDQKGNLLSKSLTGADDANVYLTRYVYDAFGREAYAIDANGAVTAFTYDNDGNVISQTAYGTLYAASGNPTLGAMESWATTNANATTTAPDRTSYFVYGPAEQLAYSIDAGGTVTAFGYDPDGNVTSKHVFTTADLLTGMPTLTAMNTWAASNARTAPDTTHGDEVTTTNYDAAGRVSDTWDATLTHTNYVYNAFGQATLITVYGAPSNEVTQNVYDNAGRLTSRTTAYGTQWAATTQYAYNGRVQTITDANDHVIQNTYDADGRLITSIVDPGGLNLTTQYQYDAFGNQVKVTDPKGNSSYAYYDSANRLILQVDALGYATQTAYDALGQATTVTSYYNPITGALTAGNPPPTPTPDVASNHTQGYSLDQITTYGRDLMGRLTSVTDPMGGKITYLLDAFGDQQTVTNQLGGVTTNTYDNMGRLKTASEAVTQTNVWLGGTTQTITNTYGYDAFGNLTSLSEASGARTTWYTYDLDNRQTSQTDVGVYVSGAATSVNAQQTTHYDAFGNVIETTDANLASTYFYYDANNNKIAEIDATGAVTTWGYDGVGNLTSQFAYGTAVTLPTTPGGAAPTGSGPSRETGYSYDAANRRTETTQYQVQYGYLSGTTYQYGLATIREYVSYDKDGNVVQTTDGNANSDYFYYDADGRKSAQVDASGYVTIYTTDNAGNVLTETQYANPIDLTSLSGVSTAAQVAALVQPSTDPTDYDRTTVSTYDRNGHVLTQTRENVVAYTVSATGALSPNPQHASTVTYAYDAMGDLVTETQATTDATTYRYDTFGRQVHSQGTAYTDALGHSVAPSTDTYYNGLGQVTAQTVGDANGIEAGRTTTTQYGGGGRIISVTDPTNFTKTYAYDLDGHTTMEVYTRQVSSSSSESDAIVSAYDADGRLTSQITGVWSGTWTGNTTTWTGNPATSNVTFAVATTGVTVTTSNTGGSGNQSATVVTSGESQDQFYDAYGEVVAQGTNTGGVQANAQTYFEYDNGGRVWLTNANDGVSRAYAYDQNGNATILFQTTGVLVNGQPVNLASMANQGLSAVFAAAQATPNAVTETVTVYDARNHVTNTIQPAANQTTNPITFQQVNINEAPGTQYFQATVTANSGAGYTSGAPGAGDVTAAAASSYTAVAGGVTITSWAEYYGPFPGYDPSTGAPIAVYQISYGVTIDPSGLSGSGTYNVEEGGGTVATITPGGGAVQIFTGSQGYYPYGYPLSGFEWSGQLSIVQAGSGRTLATVNVPAGGSATASISPSLELQGINSTATAVHCFARQNSSGPYYELDATEDASGYWHVDMTQPPFGSQANATWELRYIAFDNNNTIVDSADGQVSTNSAGAPTASAFTPDQIGGSGQSMMTYNPNNGQYYLTLTGLPAATTSVTINYGPGMSSSASASNFDYYQINIWDLDATLKPNGAFSVEAFNSANQQIGQYDLGSFSVFTPTGSSPQLTPTSEANRTLNLYPAAGQASQIASQTFTCTVNGVTTSLTPVNQGSYWTVDLSSLTTFYSEVSGTFQWTTYDSSGHMLSQTTGPFSVGYESESAPTSQQAQKSPIPSQVVFSPPQNTAQTPVSYIKLYWRNEAAGASAPFNTATVSNVNNVFALNVDTTLDSNGNPMRSTSSTNDIEYYYDAYSANGTLIPPPNGDDHIHGQLVIQPNSYTAIGSTYVQWAASGLQHSQYLIDRQQTWNAFGEISSETDGDNNVTTLAYNTLGELTTKTGPQVNAGYIGSNNPVTPTQTYFYDISGRLVGEEDADNNFNTQILLAGSGYDGQASQTVTQFQGMTQATGGGYTTAAETTQYAYDAFGEVGKVTDGLNDVTTNVYDGDGNLVTVDHAQRSSTDNSPNVQLIDNYTYDGLGQRIGHSDNQSLSETTTYDAQGRVIATTDMAGLTTRYAHNWENASQLTNAGLGTSSGWQTVTTNSAGYQSIDDEDIFGHEATLTNGNYAREDFGGNTYQYAYNLAGELVSQSSTPAAWNTAPAQSISYTYFTNGYVASVTDTALGMQSTYEYDNDGNRTLETYAKIGANPVYYEDATISYDALNRVTQINDATGEDITYAYDANGNRLEMDSVYTDPATGKQANQDYYYSYDSMNRFVDTMFTKSTTGVIGIGLNGTVISYDAAGNRSTATYVTTDSSGQTYTDEDFYTYTADGYLENTTTVSTNNANHAATSTLIERTNNALGQVTTYLDPTITKVMTYDGDGRLLTETDSSSSNGTSTAVTTNNGYKLYDTADQKYDGNDEGVISNSSTSTVTTTSSGSTTVTAYTAYTYGWWDQAQETAVKTSATLSAPNAGNWAPGYSSLTYDANGHLVQMVDQVSGRTLDYTDDAYGQVLQRQEWDSSGSVMGPLQQYYYFNGKQVGEVSNNGQNPDEMDYAQQLAQTPADSGGKGGFRNGTPVTSANFDENFQPINDQYPAMSGRAYTLTQADVAAGSLPPLERLAQNLWGDADLWYLIADANGITLSTNLVAGQILSIPNKVANFHNNANTFKVYDPGQAIGDDLPTLPPDPSDNAQLIDDLGIPYEDLPPGLEAQFVPAGMSANGNLWLTQGVAWGTPPGVEDITSMLGAGPMSVVDGGDFNETAHGDYNEGEMDQIYAALGAGNVVLTPQQTAQVAALDGAGGYSLDNAGLTMTPTFGVMTTADPLVGVQNTLSNVQAAIANMARTYGGSTQTAGENAPNAGGALSSGAISIGNAIAGNIESQSNNGWGGSSGQGSGNLQPMTSVLDGQPVIQAATPLYGPGDLDTTINLPTITPSVGDYAGGDGGADRHYVGTNSNGAAVYDYNDTSSPNGPDGATDLPGIEVVASRSGSNVAPSVHGITDNSFFGFSLNHIVNPTLYFLSGRPKANTSYYSLPGPSNVVLRTTSYNPGRDNPNIPNIDPSDPIAVNGHAWNGDGSAREADFRQVSLAGMGPSIEDLARQRGSSLNLAIQQAAATGQPVPINITGLAADASPMFTGAAPTGQQEALGRFQVNVSGTVSASGGLWSMDANVTGVTNLQAYTFDMTRGPVGIVANAVGGLGQMLGGGKNYYLSFFGSQTIHVTGQR